jgi:hypothetical protein
MSKAISIPITDELQNTLVLAQRALAVALAEMAHQVERVQPGGALPLLAAIQSGAGTVVATIEVAPAGPCSLELVVGTRRVSLGLLTSTPKGPQAI